MKSTIAQLIINSSLPIGVLHQREMNGGEGHPLKVVECRQ